MPSTRDRRPHPMIRRRALAALAIVLTVASSACGVKTGTTTASTNASGGPSSGSSTTGGGGSSTTTAPSTGHGGPTTTEAGPTATTTTTAPSTSVPATFQSVHRDDIGVTISVPASWLVTDVDPNNLTAAQTKLAEENPQLAGLFGQGAGLYADAKIVAGAGPATATGTETAVVAQLSEVLPSIPPSMAGVFKSQFEAAGATKVSTASLVVPGSATGAQSLRIDVTLELSGQSVTMHELVVPTAKGLAIVAVRAGDPVGEQILASARVV